ncbi:MAG: tetratricopeptide repeat protein [Gammaproteobacteria bacterium]|nr:tetratricopeptide repeat protein [Gammaproteobacteria bacterium]
MAPKQNVLTRSKKKQALALFQANRLAEARRLFEEICAADRSDAEAWLSLGIVCSMLGELPQGEAHCRRAVTLKPDHVHAHYNLANILAAQNRPAEALAGYDQVLRLNPGHVQAHNNRGNALASLGRADEAIASYKKAMALQPDNAEAYNNLGAVYGEEMRLTEARECYERALRLDPNYVTAHYNLAGTLFAENRLEEALASYKNALRLRPDYVDAHNNLLFGMNYLPAYTPAAIFQEHRLWGERHARTVLPVPAFANVPDPERRLRIGYVSPDFRTHSVAYFIEPILARHNRERFEIFCYSALAKDKHDETTAHLQALDVVWRDIHGLNDAALAGRIRADGVDILVDLAGHTAHSRIMAFRYKPAPVQVSWLGYPNTTGLPAMDYRLTDEWADPPGQEAFHTERLVRLPRGFLCYLPPTDAPEVAAPPAQTAGHVTFGSFNVLPKITPQVVAQWARILTALPEARLVLKNKFLGVDEMREGCYAQFERHGIARSRIDIVGRLPALDDHLARYGQIDIALDTFPYNGTTTTCEALWMGVPVVALAGERHAARVGASLLTRMGLTELIARTPEEYVKLAVELANDAERLTRLRAGLRERMMHSSLCDAAGFTADLERVYREIWAAWCHERTP